MWFRPYRFNSSCSTWRTEHSPLLLCNISCKISFAPGAVTLRGCVVMCAECHECGRWAAGRIILFFVKTPIPGVESWQDYAGHCGNEIADGLARGGSSLRFLGPKPALGVSRRDLQREPVAGWSTSTGLNGEVLVTPRDRLGNLSRDPVWVPGLNFLPSIGLIPGL
jgi:hypothetical protein